MIFLVSILVFIVVAIAALAGYVVGMRGGFREVAPGEPQFAPVLPALAPADRTEENTEMERVGIEKARIIRSLDGEVAVLRATPEKRAAPAEQVAGSRHEYERLNAKLADAIQECARYRQLVVDIENNAPPPILSGAGEPDDLKLIVGIGPVLERMLHNLGVTTFRQIARWSERDSAEFDAKLPEFPGRIVRDQWVTQARELHLAKFGELPSDRPPR